MLIARVYLRVSTEDQDTARQESIIYDAKAKGYYIAAVYREKASGALADRPELLRMIEELQPDEVVIAEKIDRITRLPLKQAEKLIDSIKAKGAKLVVPGLVDLSEIADGMTGTARIVMDAMQSMLLKLALQMAYDDYTTRRERQNQGIRLAMERGVYTGRKADTTKHEQIRMFRAQGCSIARTAELTKCSESLVKLVMRKYKAQSNDAST
ncbi:recombinase family protein [Aeromonas hydrophila]|uniref:recombinase family protein n=1 Tax=Aeromonas hydrophila TaxID=644 RepID=UPI00080731A3|nr:recombinase family protein [Aeromonas hydrophila]ANR99226.1 resolvase [Aeromonas hydrophila]